MRLATAGLGDRGYGRLLTDLGYDSPGRLIRLKYHVVVGAGVLLGHAEDVLHTIFANAADASMIPTDGVAPPSGSYIPMMPPTHPLPNVPPTPPVPSSAPGYIPRLPCGKSSIARPGPTAWKGHMLITRSTIASFQGVGETHADLLKQMSADPGGFLFPDSYEHGVGTDAKIARMYVRSGVSKDAELSECGLPQWASELVPVELENENGLRMALAWTKAVIIRSPYSDAAKKASFRKPDTVNKDAELLTFLSSWTLKRTGLEAMNMAQSDVECVESLRHATWSPMADDGGRLKSVEFLWDTMDHDHKGMIPLAPLLAELQRKAVDFAEAAELKSSKLAKNSKALVAEKVEQDFKKVVGTPKVCLGWKYTGACTHPGGQSSCTGTHQAKNCNTHKPGKCNFSRTAVA